MAAAAPTASATLNAPAASGMAPSPAAAVVEPAANPGAVAASALGTPARSSTAAIPVPAPATAASDRRKVADGPTATIVRQDGSPLPDAPERPDPRAPQRPARRQHAVGVNEGGDAQPLGFAALPGQVECVGEHGLAVPRTGTAEPCG
jgi:hypothetical protein